MKTCTVSIFCHCRYSVQSVLDANSKLYAPKTLSLGCKGANNALAQKVLTCRHSRVSLGPAFPVQNAIGIHVDLRKLPTKRSSPFIHYSNKAKRRKQTAESRAASIPEGTASLHSSLNYSTGFSLLPLQASACSLYRQEAARGWRQSAEGREQSGRVL